MAGRIKKIGGWVAVVVGALDWFGRYQSARDLLGQALRKPRGRCAPVSPPWAEPRTRSCRLRPTLDFQETSRRAQDPGESKSLRRFDRRTSRRLAPAEI